VSGALRPCGRGQPYRPGQTRLVLATEPAHLIPAFGCPAALLGPARVTVVSGELLLQREWDGEVERVVWPSGWVAWRRDGRAELVSRDGAVVGREGELVEGYGGGVSTDDLFHVCQIGS
jgi:hypothetical protein